MSGNVIFWWCIVLLGVSLVAFILAAIFVGGKADDDMERYMEELKNE